MKKKVKTMDKRAWVWALGRIVVLCGILALAFTNSSTYQPSYDEGTKKYIYENAGTVFTILMFGLGFALAWLQKYVYWPFLNKMDRAALDERQNLVRQRVFERAYRRFILIVILSLWLINIADDRVQLVLPWVLGGAFLLLPSVIATGQKDS